MSRARFGIVFILLILILLVVSTLFGVLTYWLDAEVLSTPAPGQGSMAPIEECLGGVEGTERSGQYLLRPAPSPLGRRGFCWKVRI